MKLCALQIIINFPLRHNLKLSKILELANVANILIFQKRKQKAIKLQQLVQVLEVHAWQSKDSRPSRSFYFFYQSKYISSLRISLMCVTQSLLKNHRHIMTFKAFSIQLWINQEGNRCLDVFSWLLLPLKIHTDHRFDRRLTWLPE